MIIYFKDVDNGRIRVDTTTTLGEKQDMSKQDRGVILIYKAHMYNEATLDPERCTHKSDEKARHSWLAAHLRQVDQYEDINNPTRELQKDDIMEEGRSRQRPASKDRAAP